LEKLERRGQARFKKLEHFHSEQKAGRSLHGWVFVLVFDFSARSPGNSTSASLMSAGGSGGGWRLDEGVIQKELLGHVDILAEPIPQLTATLRCIADWGVL
jgi:hypothetical protein